MLRHLGLELEALKLECFKNAKYLEIRERLKRNNRKVYQEFRDVEHSFLFLVSHIAASEEGGVWNEGGRFRVLLTAHVTRLFHKMGVPLDACWNLSKPQDHRQGILLTSTREILNAYRQPEGAKPSFWGEDFWDDCYTLLALLEVAPELYVREHEGDSAGRPLHPTLLHPTLKERVNESLRYLKQEVQDGFKLAKKQEWFGPAFYAAGIELFDYLIHEKERHPTLADSDAVNKLEPLIDLLAAELRAVLSKGFKRARGGWFDRFAWHAGQVIVTWETKRSGYMSLVDLSPLIAELYTAMLARQNRNTGAWDNNGKLQDPEEVNYCTARALAACYAMEKDPSESAHVQRTHRFLLREASESPPFRNPKACVNVLEAYQMLFEFTLPNIHLNLLGALFGRLDRLGLSTDILGNLGRDADTLVRVRASARKKLEGMSTVAVEALGVNGQMLEALEGQVVFNEQFAGNSTDVQKRLFKFLSSTMTEVRSNTARSLIKDLWTPVGFLNFLPLIAHLSNLEQDRAFFDFYRDHLNHEVLLFLLGAYIYYSCEQIRTGINEEIVRQYDEGGVWFDPKRIENEFLFRWKLISTFHDIGYLFEVHPQVDPRSDAGSEDEKSSQRELEKRRLLRESLGVVESFRRTFLADYLKTSSASGSSSPAPLIDSFGWHEYTPRIAEVEDLFGLNTSLLSRDSFEVISQHIYGDRIPKDLVRNYFELCRSTDARRSDGKIQRTRFLDHGVMSALILLKTADIQRDCLRQLANLALKGKLRKYGDVLARLRDARTDEALEEKQFYIRFSHVAGAIALHNLYPQLYSEAQCREFDKSRHPARGLRSAFYPRRAERNRAYGISLKENALAFLAALADVLQDWDRHSFRRPTFDLEESEPLSAAEVLIRGDEGRIHVYPLSEQARRRYESHARSMDEYLIDWKTQVEIHNIGPT